MQRHPYSEVSDQMTGFYKYNFNIIIVDRNQRWGDKPTLARMMPNHLYLYSAVVNCATMDSARTSVSRWLHGDARVE